MKNTLELFFFRFLLFWGIHFSFFFFFFKKMCVYLNFLAIFLVCRLINSVRLALDCILTLPLKKKRSDRESFGLLGSSNNEIYL